MFDYTAALKAAGSRHQPSDCRRFLTGDASSSLQSCSGHSKRHRTADTWITTSDRSVTLVGFKTHLQTPKLTRLLLLPWQQHHGSPHALLTVSSSLRKIPEVTNEVIYHTCHLAHGLLSASPPLWSTTRNNGPTICCRVRRQRNWRNTNISR